MICKPLMLSDLAEFYIKKNDIKDAIVVFCDTADDGGNKFMNEIKHDDHDYIFQDCIIIEGSYYELQKLIRKYHTKMPYLQQYQNGECIDENT